MKILYDHQVFSWQKYGGISRYFYEIIKRIALSNHVYFYQGYNVNKYNLDEVQTYEKYFSKKKYEIAHTGRLYNFINMIGLKCFSKINKVDIYHPTYYNYYNLNNGKLIVTVHDMIHELFSKEFKNDITSEKKEKIIKKADGIICVSQNTKKDLINIFNVDEKKIKVIYLANSLDEKVDNRPYINNKYILYVGNRKGYKNFKTLIDAYVLLGKDNSDVKIICFGGGPFDKEELYLLNKLNIINRVEQLSGNDKILSNLYNFAEFFVYPSKYEGFGISPLEAMHYGTPVIVSNVSSIPEVVGDAGLYFDPNSVEDLAEKMKMLLKNKSLRNDFIDRGKKRVKLFSWDKCANETINFYSKIING
ncbi:glycosyltransferase family 4 protein [Megamonas funiformis]|uniref:glycosyltransferase family 4 protein n=1 Tax=Megamonas funiformis TaxID=437897 RepID=UPI00265D311C|nr:glycosyltransferase family 1 protein [Megamonas funiformis]